MVEVLNRFVIVLTILLALGFIGAIGTTILTVIDKIGMPMYCITLSISLFLITVSILNLSGVTLSDKTGEVYLELQEEKYVKKEFVNLEDYTFSKEGNTVYLEVKIADKVYKREIKENTIINSDEASQMESKVLVEEVTLTKNVPSPLGVLLKLTNKSYTEGDLLDIKVTSVTRGNNFPK